MVCYSLDDRNNRNKPKHERIVDAIGRLKKRTEYHTLLYKLVYLAERNGLRLIIENPATKPSYLIDTQNFPKPTVIDKNRMERGDFFKKPTAYWFFNCEPTHGFSRQNDKEQRFINKCRGAPRAGLCSEERSMISPDYARNWICDFVLGKDQHLEPTLFDEDTEAVRPENSHTMGNSEPLFITGTTLSRSWIYHTLCKALPLYSR